MLDRLHISRFTPETASHVLPFAVWIGFIFLFEIFNASGNPLPDSWLPPAYALKSVICAALLLILRPWRFYRKSDTAGRPGGIAESVAAGILLAVIWITPETPLCREYFPGFADFYNRWLIMPPASFPDYYSPVHFPALPPFHSSLSYSPERCGWFLTIAKLLGSAFVIPFAEEYFFRGFLYRWLRKSRFTEISLSEYDAYYFWIIVLIFGLEHDRWFAGMVAGALFGWLVLRTGRILPAAIAHSITNLLLAIYVIYSNQYGFW